MNLLVTGASGFLGQYVVAEALRHGHTVRAMVRPGSNATGLTSDGTSGKLELVRADLRSRDSITPMLENIDAIIHLAASKGGDVFTQYGGTVIATENLLSAMEQVQRTTGKRIKLVHISSFSIYDYVKPLPWAMIDENAAVERDAMDRDGYAHTKLVQERVVRETAAKNGWELVVLRPGMIYGKDNLWNAFCGLQARHNIWLRPGAFAQLALTYVENVAEAIVLGAEKPEAIGQTLNLVDDPLPSRRQYLKLVQQHWPSRLIVLPLPYLLMMGVARAAWMTNTLLLGKRAKLPGLFIPARLAARLKPFRYSNARAKRVLGWQPRYDLETAVKLSSAASAGNGNPLPTTNDSREEGRSPKSFRIAYLTGEYPRATDTFIQREVAALRTMGVDVETFSIRKPALKEHVGPEQLAEKERTFYVLPPHLAALIGTHAKLLLKSPSRWFSGLKLAWSTRTPGVKGTLLQLAYLAEAGLIAGRMRQRNLSHLHNHFADSSCSVAMLASHLGDFPYSFTIHGPAEFFEPKRWRLDEKVRRAKFVACISHFCRSQMMCFSAPAEWDKLKIIHCGVHPADYRASPIRPRGSRLLFVGRLAGVKGVPVLLDALAQIVASRPDVVLHIAGDGPERNALEQQAGRLGISQNVKFLGYQTQSQVRALLQETDVFVMASFAEGVPVVLMEAMASGVPVVSTRIAGIPELVQDGVSGCLVAPGDADAIAKSVSALLEDPALRERLAKAGRDVVEREFNLAREAGRLRHVFAESLVS